jgi:uncharacterized protein (TIGR03067 family)
MHIRHTFRIFVFAALFGAIGADKPDDVKAIEGNWRPVRAELGGQPVPETVLKTIRLRLEGGKYEASVAGEADRGTYTLSSSSNPRGMTVTGTDGPNKGKTFPSIYDLDGDTLRICYDLSGTKRPTKFETVAGTRLYLVTYARVKG